ncbi:MAG: RNA methyltransferase [Anaerolineales bacterium]|nr:RNA methyltransferase [Anaerolineales bacterium]
MITSKDNPTIKWIRSLQSGRKYRRQSNAFVIEGPKLLNEALQAGNQLEHVLLTEDAQVHESELLSRLPEAVVPTPVSEQVLASCSDAVTPQGLLAVVSTPVARIPDPCTFALVLDRVRDPGNLGTLLRTARAAGVEVVLLTEGTVDPFNPKVVRAGMGAQLVVPILEISTAMLPALLPGMRIWIADSGGGTPYDSVDWQPPTALVVGNETHGTSEELLFFAHGRVNIPMPGSAESLNAAVAGAVLLFEIVRQRKR